jgi:subtilisin family serine protease
VKTIFYHVRDQLDRPFGARGCLRVLLPDKTWDTVEVDSDPDGQVIFRIPDDAEADLLTLFPDQSGYWLVAVDAPPSGAVVRCDALPSANATDVGGWWWHEALNIAAPNPLAGAGIKIGVIDLGFKPVNGIEHVAVTTYTGAAAHIGSEPFPSHGEIVCRIIGQRATLPTRCEGFAPGAELTCVAADSGTGKLDLAVATSAILHLAQDREVDLINLSAGFFDNSLLGLRSAIRAAARLGTLCIVAAGNDPRPAIAFPARYPDCIGVGAIGLIGWGSPSSAVWRYGQRSSVPAGTLGALPDGRPIFHHFASAYGEGLDLVAPGVGILINRATESLLAVSGTSYAAPMVCGLLATVLSQESAYLALPRGPNRTDEARAVLKRMCYRTGIAPEYEGAGLTRVP